MSTTEIRSRRDEYSGATHQALLDSAQTLFATQGFAATSLDEVAAQARLTKGAIYHHFPSKVALFQAVLDRLEQASLERFMAAGQGAGSALELATAALDAFLEDVADPTLQQICFVEGPAALGFEQWWACGEKYHIDAIATLLKGFAGEGLIDPKDVGLLSHLLFGMVTAGVLNMVRSEDPAATRDQIRELSLQMVAGLLGTEVATTS